MSKRFVVLASIGFFIVFAIKACIVLNDFYAMEAKWDVNIKNCTSIENPSVKIIIDGYGVSVSADERRFWGPAGDVEKIITPPGTYAVVTDLSNIQTDLNLILYEGKEPSLPKEMLVIDEKACLLRKDHGINFEKDCLGKIPYGTKLKVLKKGAPATYCITRENGEHELVSSSWIKVVIPGKIRKENNLPRTGWVFGGYLSENSDKEM